MIFDCFGGFLLERCWNVAGTLLEVAGTLLEVAGTLLEVAGMLLEVAGSLLEVVSYTHLRSHDTLR